MCVCGVGLYIQPPSSLVHRTPWETRDIDPAKEKKTSGRRLIYIVGTAAQFDRRYYIERRRTATRGTQLNEQQ
jgi:hypothetical protein